jgi:hypothetical protein
MRLFTIRLYASLVLVYSLASCLRITAQSLWTVFLLMLRAIWAIEDSGVKRHP